MVFNIFIKQTLRKKKQKFEDSLSWKGTRQRQCVKKQRRKFKTLFFSLYFFKKQLITQFVKKQFLFMTYSHGLSQPCSEQRVLKLTKFELFVILVLKLLTSIKKIVYYKFVNFLKTVVYRNL